MTPAAATGRPRPGPARRLSPRGALAAAAYGLWVLLLGGTLPTPLYPVYEARYHFGATIVTVTFAVYAVGVLVGLFLVGRSSDTIGRRPIQWLGFAAAAASAVVFVTATSVWLLWVGRIVSGFSVGVVTSTSTAALTELEPMHDVERASRIGTGVNLTGLASGPLLAGVLAQYLPAPTVLVFLVDLALLAPAACLVLGIPETAPERTQGARWKLTRLSVPPVVRAPFATAGMTVFAGFAVVGLYSALTGSLLHASFGITNLAIVGGAVFLLFGGAALVQYFWGRTRSGSPIVVGIATLVAGVVLNLAAVVLRSEVAFWSGLAVSGAGYGLSFLGSLELLNEAAPRETRGEILAGYFVLAYLGLSLPVVGVGFLTEAVGAPLAAVVFSGIVIGLLAVALGVRRRYARGRRPSDRA